MISRPQINLREHYGSPKLIQQIVYPRQWILILYSQLIQLTIINTQPQTAVLFLYQEYRCSPRCDALGRMNFFSSKSSICFFNSANSAGAMDTGPAPRIRSMVKSTCLLGGNSGISSGNTSAYSSTTDIILIFSTVLFFSVWATIIKQVAPASTSFIQAKHCMKTTRKAWKSEEVWLSQEGSNKKLDLAVFFIFMIEDNWGKIYL